MRRLFLILMMFLGFTFTGMSQCPMCKTTVENAQNGEGKGLNKAILYLLVTPFAIGIIGGGAFYISYRNAKKRAELNLNNPDNF